MPGSMGDPGLSQGELALSFIQRRVDSVFEQIDAWVGNPSANTASVANT